VCRDVPDARDSGAEHDHGMETSITLTRGTLAVAGVSGAGRPFRLEVARL